MFEYRVAYKYLLSKEIVKNKQNILNLYLPFIYHPLFCIGPSKKQSMALDVNIYIILALVIGTFRHMVVPLVIRNGLLFLVPRVRVHKT